mmetsp:Transcript_2329/g.6585  ORF Transcript_2329/g.6585 Transcript_2329/m.6585 type:complete len:164 (+) Transcript_2329:245-736(+)
MSDSDWEFVPMSDSDWEFVPSLKGLSGDEDSLPALEDVDSESSADELHSTSANLRSVAPTTMQTAAHVRTGEETSTKPSSTNAEKRAPGAVRKAPAPGGSGPSRLPSGGTAPPDDDSARHTCRAARHLITDAVGWRPGPGARVVPGYLSAKSKTAYRALATTS